MEIFNSNNNANKSKNDEYTLIKENLGNIIILISCIMLLITIFLETNKTLVIKKFNKIVNSKWWIFDTLIIFLVSVFIIFYFKYDKNKVSLNLYKGFTRALIAYLVSIFTDLGSVNIPFWSVLIVFYYLHKFEDEEQEKEKKKYNI